MRATERRWLACRGRRGFRLISASFVPLAARALAGRAEGARDVKMTDSVVLAELRSLTERFLDVVTDSGQPTPLMIIQRSAMTAWYAAEVGRARRSVGSGELWLQTSGLFNEGGLPWQEMYAWRRAAEALLGGSRQTRAEGRRALRRGYQLACELQAESTRARAGGLAEVPGCRWRLACGPPARRRLCLDSRPGSARFCNTSSLDRPTPRSPALW